MFQKELESFGLTPGEAKVYESLLILGHTKVGPIVQKSKVAYSNIYSILHKLADKGLVTVITKEKIKYFNAVAPERIVDYLTKQEKEMEAKKKTLTDMLPRIEKLSSTSYSKQQIEMFVGIKGIKSAYEVLLKDSHPGDCFFYFSSYKNQSFESAKVFYKGIYSLFRKKHITVRGLSDRKVNVKMIKEKLLSFSPPGNIDIFQDKVLLISWGVEPISVLIKSSEIATSFRDNFEELWEHS